MSKRLSFGLVVILFFAAVLAVAWLLPASPPPPAPSTSRPAPTFSPTSEQPGGPGAPTVTPAPPAEPTRARTGPRRATSPPPVRQTDPDVVPSYPNCHDLNLDHPEGVETGHPAYRPDWDPDHDGWACDPQ